MSMFGPSKILLCWAALLSVCNGSPHKFCKEPNYMPSSPNDANALLPVCDGSPGFIRVSGGSISHSGSMSGGSSSQSIFSGQQSSFQSGSMSS
ncbi:unnamed protein product, partial [Staurois parvus]